MNYTQFTAKLKSAGFVEQIEADADHAGHWSRPTIFGGQVDKGTGKRPVIYVDVNKHDETATMSMASYPLKTGGLITISREGVSLAEMGKFLKNFEQGIVYAWREIAD